MSEYDAIVIGAGQAGPPLAMRLAASGRKVAVVERDLVGGTCVNTGCTPTKTLVASAYAAHLARRAADFGVVINGGVRIDMKRVKARKDAVVAASRDGLRDSLRSTANLTLIEGHARFASAHAVEAGSRMLRAPQIFIDTGSRAVLPPIPGLGQVAYLTNGSILDLEILPRHLVIVGGSTIAVEFAQMFRRFGSAVTIIERGERLIGREDADVSDAVRAILANEGVVCHLAAACTGVRADGADIKVAIESPAGTAELVGSHLLIAVGRRPNTDEVGLDAAGVARDARGFITVDEQLRTNVEGIWAMGDCNGRGAFTHTSYNDAEIVAANLLDDDPRRVSDRIAAYAIYVDPPLGRAGMTKAEAAASGRRVLIGERPMTRVSRAIEKGETQGFMRILVDGDSKEILGGAVLGPGGDEVIHCILDLMLAKAPYTVLQRAMHIHPTVSELLPTILQSLQPL